MKIWKKNWIYKVFMSIKTYINKVFIVYNVVLVGLCLFYFD